MNNFSPTAIVIATIVDQHLTAIEMLDIARLFLNEHYDITPKTKENYGFSPADMADIFNHIAAGRKIDAIKLYRNKTGLVLKDSKDAIEDLMSRIS